MEKEDLKVPWATLLKSEPSTGTKSGLDEMRNRQHGRQRIRMRTAPRQPRGTESAHQPIQIERSMALVDRQLTTVFAALMNGEERWPLFISGPAGVGKTFAAKCLLDWTIGDCAFRTAEDLGYQFFDRAPGDYTDLLKAIILVVDEVGSTGAASDPHKREQRAVKKVADMREIQANRVAIYISNLPREELKKVYDDRLMDRLTCGTCVQLGGGSLR